MRFLRHSVDRFLKNCLTQLTRFWANNPDHVLFMLSRRKSTICIPNLCELALRWIWWRAYAVLLCRYKGSRELTESDKYSMSKDGDTYVLVVSDVFGEDADEYCVKATTPAGSRASRADLVIKSQWHLSTQTYGSLLYWSWCRRCCWSVQCICLLYITTKIKAKNIDIYYDLWLSVC